MAKRKTKKTSEPDSVFVLKIILYFILGSLWLQFQAGDYTVGLPVGLLLGLYFAHHEHFAIDRKLEYVVLLSAGVLSFFLPTGFILAI